MSRSVDLRNHAESCEHGHGAPHDVKGNEFFHDDCPGGAVVPVVEMQWCNTHSLPMMDRRPDGPNACWFLVALHDDDPDPEACVRVTRHMLEVSE